MFKINRNTDEHFLYYKHWLIEFPFVHKAGSWQELVHRAKTMRSLVTCLINQSLYSRNFFYWETTYKKGPTGVFDGQQPSGGGRDGKFRMLIQ